MPRKVARQLSCRVPKRPRPEPSYQQLQLSRLTLAHRQRPNTVAPAVRPRPVPAEGPTTSFVNSEQLFPEASSTSVEGAVFSTEVEICEHLQNNVLPDTRWRHNLPSRLEGSLKTFGHAGGGELTVTAGVVVKSDIESLHGGFVLLLPVPPRTGVDAVGGPFADEVLPQQPVNIGSCFVFFGATRLMVWKGALALCGSEKASQRLAASDLEDQLGIIPLVHPAAGWGCRAREELMAVRQFDHFVHERTVWSLVDG